VSGRGTPAATPTHNGYDTAAAESRGTCWPRLLLTRCADDIGGRAIGALIIGWHRARDLYVCGCCADVIEPDAVAVDVERRDGLRTVVCADCAGVPGR
jgi:hypothetical protein